MASCVGLQAGTPVTWTDSGGTNVMTLKSLASGGTRQGVKGASLVQTPPGCSTATLPAKLTVNLSITFASAPADGGEFQIGIGYSNSSVAATNNPAGLTGTDTTLLNISQIPQGSFIGALVASATLGTGIQMTVLEAYPLDVYPIPFVYNNTSVGTSTVSATSTITMTPWYAVVSS